MTSPHQPQRQPQQQVSSDVETDRPRLDQRFHEQDSNMRGTSQSVDQEPHAATVQQRRLCEGVANHCFQPEEKNVFSPPIPPPPTMAPTLISDRTVDSTNSCQADEQGNYGETDGPSRRVVYYQYQVETTTEVSSALELNVNVLQDVENTISDYMLQNFFSACSSPPILVLMPDDTNAQQQQLQSIAKIDDRSRMETDPEGSHNRLVRNRNMKTEDHEEIKGLSAEPMDQVLSGVACPFPTTPGPCFVVEGGLAVYGDNTAVGGLLWVDEVIHEELQLIMNTAELEAALQPEHPEITAIRYIPAGTELPTTPSPNPDATTDETSIGTTNSSLSWVLIGVGFFLVLAVVFVYTCLSRRRKMEEEERNASIQAGAFPVLVSQTNVARAQRAQRGSPNKAAKPFHEIPRDYSYPPSSNRDSSESDDSDDEGVRLHVFHDDDNYSPRRIPKGISTSWRDQILRIPTEVTQSLPLGSGTSISLDPNQPFVRPILDDEHVGHNLSFPSIEYQSSAEFTHYHSVNSRELQKSPNSFHTPESGAKSDTASSHSSSRRHRRTYKREIV